MISAKLLTDVSHEALLYVLPFECGYFASDANPEKADWRTLNAAMALIAINVYANPFADAAPPIN